MVVVAVIFFLHFFVVFAYVIFCLLAGYAINARYQKWCGALLRLCVERLINLYPVQHDNLLMGNGSSELIDLIIRLAPSGPYSVGPNEVQYKEYENSCHRYNRELATDPKAAALHVFVNPTNPTGEYMTLEKTKRYIEDNCRNGRYVLFPLFHQGCIVMIILHI